MLVEKRVRALAAQEMCVSEQEIINVTRIKLGMTNCSFLFEYQGKRYIISSLTLTVKKGLSDMNV